MSNGQIFTDLMATYLTIHNMSTTEKRILSNEDCKTLDENFTS